MSDRTLLADVVATLTTWTAPNERQDGLRTQYLSHLSAQPDAIWRSGPPAHLTASCFVLDPTAERTLLTLHRKGGFWVQFGGHLEPGDATLAEAALREAREESGVQALDLLRDATDVAQPIDLDRHRLPASFGRCAEHLDVAFVAIAPADADPVVSDESDAVAWWPVDHLPPDTVADLRPRLRQVVAAVRAAPRPSSSSEGSITSSVTSRPDAAATPSR